MHEFSLPLSFCLYDLVIHFFHLKTSMHCLISFNMLLQLSNNSGIILRYHCIFYGIAAQIMIHMVVQ